MSVAVCTNAIDGAALGLADGLVALAVLAAAEPDGAPVDAGVDRFCGRYASLWGVLDVVRLGSRLLLVDPTSPDPAAHVVAVEPDGDDFRVVRSPGYGSYGEPLVFTTDAAGAVTAVRAPGGTSLWPVDRVRAFVDGRDEVRLGDLADGPG